MGDDEPGTAAGRRHPVVTKPVAKPWKQAIGDDGDNDDDESRALSVGIGRWWAVGSISDWASTGDGQQFQSVSSPEIVSSGVFPVFCSTPSASELWQGDVGDIFGPE